MTRIVEAFNYRVGMNATGMTTGGRLTRRELSQVRGEFRRMTTPTERLNHRIDLLSKAYKTGAISQAEFAEGQRRLRAQMPAAESAIRRMTSSLSMMPGRLGGMGSQLSMMGAMGPKIAALAVGIWAATAAYRVALSLVRSFTNEMQNQIGMVTDLSQKSRALGTEFRELATFQFLFAQDAGIGAEQSSQMFAQFARGIGEAAQGTGRARQALEMLNLEAGELASMDPAQAFRRVVEEAHKLENPIDRAVVATGLFRNQGVNVAAIFEEGVGAIDSAADAAERMGLALDGAQALGIERLDASMGELRLEFEGLARSAMAEVAPVLTVLVRDATMLFRVMRSGTSAAGTFFSVARLEASRFIDIISMANPAIGAMVGAFRMLGFDDALSGYLDSVEARSAAMRRQLEEDAKATQERVDAGREAAKIEREAEEAAKRQEEVAQRIESLRLETLGTQERSTEAQIAEFEALGATAEQLQEVAALQQRIAAMKEQEQREKEAEQEQRRAEREAEQRRAAMQREADSIRQAFAAPEETLAERFVELDRLARAGMISVREMVLARNAAVRDLVSDTAMGGVTTAGAFSADAQRAMFEQQQQERRERIERARAEKLMREADELARREGRRLRANEQITEQMERQAAAAARINPSPDLGGGASDPGTGTLSRIADATERAANRLEELEPAIGI